MEITKSKAWLIRCNTGCSCCSNENHSRGPFQTEEDAKKRVAYYRSENSKFWPVASQYSRRGNYKLQEINVETLPDGRRIIDSDYVVDADEFNLVEVLEDGAIEDNDSEFFREDEY